MKKIISSILMIVISANSCRSQEDFETEILDNDQTTNVLKKNNDSVQADSTKIVNIPILIDPPPKNGHQW